MYYGNSVNIYLIFRTATVQVPGVSEGVQAQTPPNRTQAAAHGRETLPVLQVLQEVLALRLLQPAHEPQVRDMQALQRLGGVATKSLFSASHLEITL